ncbi:MAG: methyltransferase domain-containing protein, partial [Bdellovibrionaceae bacterium]|nr:methyltransferase domain-containing protein [Pseudobdellovibrionaceae bacterium]
PMEKTELYNGGYFSGAAGDGGYMNYQAEYLSHAETFRARLQDAEKQLGRQGRLLDYGCAYGHLGHVAAQSGWDVVATDIAFEAVHRAVHEYGLAGFVSDLAQPPLKKGAFDLVTLYDVIEHVQEPKSIISALSGLLTSDGFLHVTTPDVSSLSAHVLGRRWYHFKPREHLLYFSRRTLRRLLESCGMQVRRMRSAPSRMTIHDILIRLRRYSQVGANAMLAIARWLRIERRVLTIHIGEMQAWANPRQAVGRRAPPALCLGARKGSVVQRLLDVLCCPSCGGDLRSAKNETLLTCSSCPETFEVRNQIPILLPKSKPARRSA